MAKAGQHLGSERIGPDRAHDFLEITADQRPYVAEYSHRNGTRLAHPKLRIDDVHAEGRVLDQMKERIVIRAQPLLGPLALGDVEVGGKRFQRLGVDTEHRGPAGLDPALDAVVAEHPVVDGAGGLAAVELLERRIHGRPVVGHHMFEQCHAAYRPVARLLGR